MLFPGLTVCDGGLADTAKSAVGAASEIFTTKASLAPPALVACSGEAVGKLFEAVKPVTYALLDVSTTIGFVEVTVLTLFSLPLPPRYVEYRNELPVELSFATNASKPPPFALCNGLTVGKFVDDVKPVT